MEEPVRSLVSHHSWLRRLARRLVRSPSAADDLVQDTCLTALSKAPPDADMRPWLRGVMRHLASHYVRGERRRTLREESYQRAVSSLTAPDGLLDYGVDRERLRELVDALPEPFRSTVVQRFLEGRSCAEIARAERVPAGTVRWRQSRALELLRTELAADAPPRSPRRRHALHWWPLAGAGQSLMGAGAAFLPQPGKSKALWVGLAGLVAIIGLALRLGPDDAVRDARASASSPATWLSRASSSLADEIDGGDESAIAPSTSSRRQAGDPSSSSEGRRRRARASASDEQGSWLQQLKDDYEQALYDCEIDEDRILRCVKGETGSQLIAVATCRLLMRSLGVIDRARRQGIRSPHPARFLATASAANLSLARALRCPLLADPDRPASGGGGGEPRTDREPAAAPVDDAPADEAPADGGESTDDGESAPDREPTCVMHDGPGGEPCTTCTDQSGDTTFCGEVECDATAEDDGAVCVSCRDEHGHVQTSCTGGTWESGCHSVVQDYGLLCSTCPGDGMSPPECLVADCRAFGGCLECRDPKGRVGSDCRLDDGGGPMASMAVGGGDTFNHCSASWGGPAGASAACRYPGTATCTFSEGGGARCIDCRYPGGAASGMCVLDPDDSMPDPMAGRPSWLPAPGDCVTETRASGMECSTCTRNDLSATTLCRLPPATECTGADGSDPVQLCVRCALTGGGEATLCELSGP